MNKFILLIVLIAVLSVNLIESTHRSTFGSDHKKPSHKYGNGYMEKSYAHKPSYKQEKPSYKQKKSYHKKEKPTYQNTKPYYGSKRTSYWAVFLVWYWSIFSILDNLLIDSCYLWQCFLFIYFVKLVILFYLNKFFDLK